MKRVRNAVRIFVVVNNKVLCIRYKEENIGYIDIPGGKIEEGETGVEAAIREVKEETGIEVSNLEDVGNVIIEYPDRIYNMKVFVTSDYIGNVRYFNKNLKVIDTKMTRNAKLVSITYFLSNRKFILKNRKKCIDKHIF